MNNKYLMAVSLPILLIVLITLPQTMVKSEPRQVSVNKAAMLYLAVGYHQNTELLHSGVYHASGESARFAYVGCGFSLVVNGAGFDEVQQLAVTIDNVLEDVIEPNGRIGSGAYGTGCGWHKVVVDSGMHSTYWLQGVDIWGDEYVAP